MAEKQEAYNALYDRLMEGENEKYVPDGTIVSLAVYSLVEGRRADSYFLYATDYETFSEPYARISIALDSAEVLLYETTEEHPFRTHVQAPKDFYREEEYLEYAECYMNIRDFVFGNNLSQEQKAALRSYLGIFRRIVRNRSEECYLEMAEEFIRWARQKLE